jgi:hypothetical protein
MTVIRAFSVPKPPVTPQLLEKFRTTLVDPFGELVAPVPITKIAETLNQRDRYEMNATDMEEVEQQWRWDLATQLVARFLIDRQGIVQWVDIEGEMARVAAKPPSPEPQRQDRDATGGRTEDRAGSPGPR